LSLTAAMLVNRKPACPRSPIAIADLDPARLHLYEPFVTRPSSSGTSLAGVRVLDMATMLAGPYAATLLGDLGADVIKLESHYGDDSRHLGPERDGERSPFLSLNRNKRSLVLDLGKPACRRNLRAARS
jgi:crotonobetainyl-CoA:carnitine CoA-transferase CaiB-like acyl-CoA transferase